MIKHPSSDLHEVKAFDGSGKVVTLLLTGKEWEVAQQRAERGEKSNTDPKEWICIGPVTGVKA